MNAVLAAKARTEFHQSTLKEIRDQGDIPAIVYGAKLESKPVTINSKDLTKTLQANGRNGIISLKLNGDNWNVILNEYQTDPIKKDIIHVDFLTVDMSIDIQVNVRIQLDGEAPGVKDGGVLQQPLHELSITTMPNNIPQEIHVDISHLQVGDNLTIADISSANGVTINHDQDEVVVTILPPKVEVEISTGEQQDGGIPDNLEGRETKPTE